MSQQIEAPSAPERHRLYGFNLALLIASGVVVVALLFYFAYWTEGKSWAAADWTSSGANSLSVATRNMLKEIVDRKQAYKIYSLFPPRSDSERREDVNKDQDDKRRQMLDLIGQYSRLCPQISAEDFGERASIEITRQIYNISKDKGELTAYEDADKEFEPLVTKLKDFLQTQATKMGKAAQAEDEKDPESMAATLQSLHRNRIPNLLDKLLSTIKEAKDQDLVNWGAIRDLMLNGEPPDVAGIADPRIIQLLTVLADKDAIKQQGFPPALAAFFVDAAPDYKKMLDEVAAMRDKIEKLKPLAMNEVFQTLSPNSVVVIGPDSAKVLNQDDLYTHIANRNQNAPPTVVFNGEQAISSAIFAMLRPDKLKVVLVSAPTQGPEAYNDIKDDLKAANFDVLTWSPGAGNPGEPPPPSDPPAIGKGVVWVVFAPAGQDMGQPGMPPMPGNPQPIIDATRKHMAAGGEVLFLAEAAGDPLGGGGGGFPYGDLIKDFGIDVQDKFTVMGTQAGRDRNGADVEQVLPFVEVKDYEDHDITRKMQSLSTMFGPSATVVSIHSPLPTGAQATVIVKSPPEAWGETGASQEPKFNPKTDMRGPVPMAVVSILNAGQKDKERRIAVIGSKTLGSDYWLEYGNEVEQNGDVGFLFTFPGNTELFKNTILWLAGYENMIAVSAKANQAARIADVGHIVLVRWLVAGLVPVLALALGVMVWVVRHR